MNPCVLYCRVSSERQVREGNGLSSQESRCRSYADAKGYDVLGVFRDEGVSGALLDRPGIQELLAFLRSRKGGGEVAVIIDDISRIARSVSTHIQLRATIKACGGRLESPSFRFEENAMGEMVETIFAAVAQYGRSGNREQVINRQQARLEAGFWTFPAPPGYTYMKHTAYKKLLMPDGVRSELIREALEGFALRRFVSKRDIVAFFKANGYYRDVGAFNSKYEMAVHRVLDNRWFYAGYIEYPPWNITRREGRHKALISPGIAYKIDDRLAGKVEKPLVRSDADDALILRNYILCAGCGRPLTGSFAKGKYPCYQCYNQGNCRRYGHRIKQRALHADFEALLKSLAVRDEVMETIEDVTRTQWGEKMAERERGDGHAQEKVRALDAQVAALVRRIGQCADEGLAQEYEREVKRLRSEREAAERGVYEMHQELPDYDAAFARVGTLLQNPYAVWESGSETTKRTVCRLAFTVPPAYDRETGFGTVDLTLPYRVSRHLADPCSRLVDLPRNTWHSLIESMVVWQERLEALDPSHLEPM